MKIIFLSFLAFWMALLPVYLWGYGVTYMLSDTWNRMRFGVGLILWWVGVGLTYVFASSYRESSLFEISIFIGFFLFLLLFILGLTLLGSKFSRVFLQKIALLHVVTIAILISVLYLGGKYFPIPEVITPLMLLFFLTPFLEEAVKHLGTVGLIGQDFHFSQKDVISFTFFVVLGFVFAENLLYLASGQFTLGTWIWRSFFTLIAHVFTAIICAHWWWKALSYPLFSARYIGTFVIGFVLAWGLHTLYNSLLAQGSILGIIIYAVVGYVLVVVRKN